MKKLLLFALLACHNPVDNFTLVLQQGAVQFEPLPIYRDYWHELEVCSGLTGNYDAIKWYRTPAIITVRDSTYWGAWLPKQNAIVLGEPNQLIGAVIVRHEEMHALLKGGLDHPAVYFRGRCGNLMND